MFQLRWSTDVVEKLIWGRLREVVMNNVNKTLYIPLYGKSYVSKKGIILDDKKAEEIWQKEGFGLKGKSKSKWLAYYMGMRSAVFDDWVKDQVKYNPNAIVLHIGCGMDSRVKRVNAENIQWYDVDFPDVIEERKKYYTENDCYHMVASDARAQAWIIELPKDKDAIVVMEGISMYFELEALKGLLDNLSQQFATIHLLMDCYTEFAAKASKYKNPINDVGVTQVYGFDVPENLNIPDGVTFVKEHSMTPDYLVAQLQGMERSIFKKLYAGKAAQKMYRLYEYNKK